MRSFVVAIACASLALTACKKEPGEGGLAEIRGRVLEQRYSANTGQPIGQPYGLAEQRVYIIYGDGSYHDDDVRTGPDGSFRFVWLQKGAYTVYTMSECNTYNGCTFPVTLRTDITDRRQIVILPDMTVQNW
jgi:hypothetical protein